MDKLKDKILQYIISGRAAEDKAMDAEILNDPAFNQEEYDLMSEIWNLSDGLKDYKTASKSDAWQNIVDATGLEQAKEVSLWRRWSVAASILILVAAGVYLFPRDPYLTSEVAENESTIALPDDTKVTLTPGSTVRYLKAKEFARTDRREIYLNGEAIFDVTYDPNRPFVVLTEHTKVDVTGTIFRYKEEGINSETENMEGQVKFGTTDGAQSVTLNKGDKASYDGGPIEVVRAEPPPPPPPPPTNHITASELVEILGDLYAENLVMAPSLRPNNVVIKVDLKLPLGELLASLAENSDVTIAYSPGRRNSYTLTTLIGKEAGFEADIDFESYINGQSFK